MPETNSGTFFARSGRRTSRQFDRATGKSDIESGNPCLLEKIDDLHKGFDSGPVFVLADRLTAVLSWTISSLTGYGHAASCVRRRRSGFIIRFARRGHAHRDLSSLGFPLEVPYSKCAKISI